MTDEQAKAVQEVAKTSGELVKASEKVGGFVSKIIGGASTQVSGILEDWAKFYRYKNLLNIADRVEAIRIKRKTEGKTIPISPRIAIPMLESASLEDDDELQEVWARLIANSTDPNFKESLHPGYIEIIRQMSPDEAIILNSFLQIQNYPVLFSNHVSKRYENAGIRNVASYWMQNQANQASYETIFEMYSNHCKSLVLKRPADSRVYIDNLLRLRITELGHDFLGEEKDTVNWLKTRMIRSSGDDKASISIPAHDEYLRMTAFGVSFVEACISKNDGETA